MSAEAAAAELATWRKVLRDLRKELERPVWDETDELELRSEVRRVEQHVAAFQTAAKTSARAKRLGAGNYGCAFEPPLPCRFGEEQMEGAEVGKVFRPGVDQEKEFAKEMAMHAVLQRLDPEGQFHVRAVGSCDVRFDRVDPKCSVRAGVPQILMRHGGTEGKVWAAQGKTAKDVKAACRPLFRGLEALSAANLVHFDTKGDNIMAGADNLLRFIDLGLVTSWASLWPEIRREWERPYCLFPPEWDYVYTPYAPANMKAELAELERLDSPFQSQFQEYLTDARDLDDDALTILAEQATCFRGNQYSLGVGLLNMVSEAHVDMSTDPVFSYVLLRMAHWIPAKRFASAAELVSTLYGPEGGAAACPASGCLTGRRVACADGSRTVRFWTQAKLWRTEAEAMAETTAHAVLVAIDRDGTFHVMGGRRYCRADPTDVGALGLDPSAPYWQVGREDKAGLPWEDFVPWLDSLGPRKLQVLFRAFQPVLVGYSSMAANGLCHNHPSITALVLTKLSDAGVFKLADWAESWHEPDNQQGAWAQNQADCAALLQALLACGQNRAAVGAPLQAVLDRMHLKGYRYSHRSQALVDLTTAVEQEVAA